LSKIPGLSGRNCLFSLNATNCRGAKPTGPQSHPPKKNPLWHKITGLVCVSQVHLYKAPKEMLGDRPFLNIYQRGKPLERWHTTDGGIRHRCVWNLPRFIKKLEKKTEVVAGSSYLVPLIRWYGIYIYSWLVFMVNVGKYKDTWILWVWWYLKFVERGMLWKTMGTKRGTHIIF